MDFCSTCTRKLKYSEEWDAKYCPKCNKWKEAKCKIEWECPLKCHLRPNKPLEENE